MTEKLSELTIEEIILSLSPEAFEEDQFVRTNASYEVIQKWNNMLRSLLRANEAFEEVSKEMEQATEKINLLRIALEQLGKLPDEIDELLASIAEDIKACEEVQEVIDHVEELSPPEWE